MPLAAWMGDAHGSVSRYVASGSRMPAAGFWWQWRLRMRKARASAANGRTPRRDAEYADLFDFAPVTYALLDSAGIVLNVNLAAARLLGVTRKHLIGRPLRAFVSEKDRGELLDHFRRCRLSFRVVESEIRFSNDARDPVLPCVHQASLVQRPRGV